MKKKIEALRNAQRCEGKVRSAKRKQLIAIHSQYFVLRRILNHFKEKDPTYSSLCITTFLKATMRELLEKAAEIKET